MLFDHVCIDLPLTMGPAAGRTGATSGMVTCMWGGDAQRARGLDDGFLKGRLGPTRFGENELYMAAADNATRTMLSQTSY